jgi:hypothetical protein
VSEKLNWVNYGDVNPLEHGGLWLLQDEENENEFDIVELLVGDSWEEGKVYFLSDGHIDVTDDWIDWDMVGVNEDVPADFKAMSAVNAYGMIEFGANPVKYTTEKAARIFIAGHGITLED